MLEPLFKKWANQVDFVFFGYCPDTLKKYAKEIHSGVSVQAYPKKLAELACEWDLAIAPLEDNMFNRCKTALKLLEYGWCGLPVLCSNVGPYQDKNFPVIRVNNKFSEWDKALQMLLSDKDHTFQLGLELQRHVQNYWTFTPDIAQNWLQAWTLQ
ncbi:Glycosyl transferases group 1 [Tepidimonas alkaliphilus]|uniref:Glycosyl transferases group 1 n=2 Tax=Tepidimonas alkaliphilus TaxID=2588942 RepID=A0A554W3L6_9BURK|nr:Glycosyl transferases group 1 [Tepidimonas alkaliphilus]